MQKNTNKELSNIPIDDDEFEIHDKDKGMGSEDLPSYINEDEDSRVFPTSQGSMLREIVHQMNKKKKGTTCAHSVDDGDKEVEEEGEKTNDVQDVEGKILPSDPTAKFFNPTFFKGNVVAILTIHSGTESEYISRGLLNTIILTRDKEKYKLTTMS